jgi:hypothetical protein
MVTYIFAKQYQHDISGIDNPNDWAYEQKNGVFYPIALLEDCVSSRPMYSNEPNYRKGMTGIYYKGELIKRHFDNPHVPDSHIHLPFVHLQYYDIDWELAGYGKNP